MQLGNNARVLLQTEGNVMVAMSRSRCKYYFLVALAVVVGGNVPAAAEQWHASNFPAPNGGLLVFAIAPNGNPECASYNGRDCLWGQPANQINFNRLRPLVCGPDHRSKWGVSGYENPKALVQLG
jgi:hypothetical protein